MVPHRLSALLLLAAAPLAAKEPYSVDVHLGALSALGDFRSEVGSRTGVDTGVSLTVPLWPRLALRPRLSREQFKVVDNNYTYQSTRYSDRGFEAAKWTAWTFGADLLFRPGGERGRLYLLTGAAAKSWRLQSYGTYTTQDRLNTTRTFSVDDSSTSNEPAFHVGLGLDLQRHLGVEARMSLASYRKLSYNTLSVGVVASF